MIDFINRMVLIGSDSPTPPTKPKLSETDLNIVFDGDSLTHGLGGTPSNNQNYPRYIQSWLSTRALSLSWNSFGVGGQTIQQMLSDLGTQILPLVDNNKTNVIVAWEDVNAILNSGRTAQQNYDDFSNYYTQCKNAGFDYCIHVGGYYPRTPYNQAGWDTGDPSPLDIQHDYFNLLSTFPDNVDVVVDLRLNTVVGGGREEPQSADFLDSVHLLQSGYELGPGDEVINNGILEIFQL